MSNEAKRITQEFFCHGCNGYFQVPLNVAIDWQVEIPCPKCGRVHRRCICHGQIYEKNFQQVTARERIIVTMATYSKTPFTQKMREIQEKGVQAREGVPLDDQAIEQYLLFSRQRWADSTNREQTGDEWHDDC